MHFTTLKMHLTVFMFYLKNLYVKIILSKGRWTLKLKIEQSDEYSEAEIIIRCNCIDKNLQRIIEQIQLSKFMLTAYKDDSTILLKSDVVFYLESVDEKTFIYCKSEVYSSPMKLYELEEMLKKSTFVRVSKSCILNIDYLESVRPLLNGKMEATLSNNEKIIINRHYVSEFKKKFGL